MAAQHDVGGIIGTFLVGGLWVVALYDYLQAPGGLNQGLQYTGATLTNIYSVLEGKGAPVSYQPVAGVGG